LIFNPIHVADLAARWFGFKHAIAHGMWSLARCVARSDRKRSAPRVCSMRRSNCRSRSRHASSSRVGRHRTGCASHCGTPPVSAVIWTAASDRTPSVPKLSLQLAAHPAHLRTACRTCAGFFSSSIFRPACSRHASCCCTVARWPRVCWRVRTRGKPVGRTLIAAAVVAREPSAFTWRRLEMAHASTQDGRTSNRGFASMNTERQRQIASMGGKGRAG